MSPVYTPAPEAETLIPGLPNDVTVNIISRIPRSYHPFLCLVSRAFRSFFLTSRHLLGSAEPGLYLIIRSNSSPNLQFFTLLDPAPDPQNGQSRRFVPIQRIPSSYMGSAYAVLGSELYVLGGSQSDAASPQVWILDCRFNKWRRGPSMLVARQLAAAGVVNGKIYVMGGCVAGSWTRPANWAEALDPRTGTWVAVPSPDKVRDKWMSKSAVVDGRIYAMAARGGVVYDTRSELWAAVESELHNGWTGSACCMVDGILYCYHNLGKIQGFDWGEGTWKELKVVETGLPVFHSGATMANMGGNLVVVWEGKEEVVRNGKEMKVWCAEIEVRKDCDGELVGRIRWSEPVLTVPAGSSIVHCEAVPL